MRLHAGLPRQGPGSDGTTAEALRRLPPISLPAQIYDLGCGPGRATLVLANILKQKIVAVDLQEEFLNQLHNSAAQKGLTNLIETRRADMLSLAAEIGTVHLIWSEGAIYCVGFDTALTAWHSLLTADGLVACTELSWLHANPATEPKTFWQENYPAMRSVGQNLIAAEQLGFACLDYFTLPESCWWDEYYGPWLHHIEKLKAEVEQDTFLSAAIANAETEINLFRRFHHEYGYVFYLLQKSTVKIQRVLSSDDAAEIARLFRHSRQSALPYLPTLHTTHEDLHYIRDQVLPNNDVFAAREISGKIIGFIAFDKEWINHLYVSPEFVRRGIGLRLLNIAKAQNTKLRLWTFQKNELAKQFYSKHGFNVIAETDGVDNEEKEPDVLFEWRSAAILHGTNSDI